MRRFSVVAVAFVAALAFLAPAAGASAPTAKQVRTLKAKVRTLTRQRDRAQDRVVALGDAVDSRNVTIGELAKAKTVLDGQVKDLTGQTVYLTGRVTDLQAQNTNLLNGLPDAIKAVPVADFSRLVFAPARAAWPCDSLYTSPGYWSYSFDSPGC